MTVVDLSAAFARIANPWDPHIVGELNGQHVKCAKLKGEFVWHHHEQEDELFLVHRGVLEMRLRDRTLTVRPGRFVIIPRDVEHQPDAAEQVEVVLFEPASTLNTGNTRNAFTKEHLKHLA